MRQGGSADVDSSMVPGRHIWALSSPHLTPCRDHPSLPSSRGQDVKMFSRQWIITMIVPRPGRSLYSPYFINIGSELTSEDNVISDQPSQPLHGAVADQGYDSKP